MDLSGLSQQDLQALSSKNLSALSEEGANYLSEAKKSKDKEIAEQSSFPTEKQFSYAFDKAETDVGYLINILRSKSPFGKISYSFEDGFEYQTAQNVYGDRFMQSSPDDRRRILNKMKEIDLQNRYPVLSQQEGLGGVQGISGSIIGSLMSPTTLMGASFAKYGYKGLALVGGLFGLEYSGLSQLSRQGVIDKDQLFTDSAIGAVAAPATGAVLKGLTAPIRKMFAKKQSPEAVKLAESRFDEIQNSLFDARAKGINESNIAQHISKATGYSKEEISESVLLSSRNLLNPTKEQAESVLSLKASSQNYVAQNRFSREVDDTLGVLSTRVKNISPEVFDGLMRYEYKLFTETADILNQAKQATNLLKSVKGKESVKLKTALLNGDYPVAENILSRYTNNASQQINNLRTIFSNIHGRLKNEAGYTDIGELENYFPRVVKNYNKLLEKLGTEQKSILQNALRAKAKQQGVKVQDLSEGDRINIINQVMRGRRPQYLGEGKISFAKERTLPRINDDLAVEYLDPVEAVELYLTKSINDINKRKFFGRNNSAKDKGVLALDLDESIGAYVSKAIDDKKISIDAGDELERLLAARFGPGEQSASQIVSSAKSIGYMSTLANPYSAITQIGDLGMSAYANGFRHTIGAMIGRKNIDIKDLGIIDAAKELDSVGGASKVLDRLLAVSGFKAIDRLGKNTLINSAYRAARASVNSDKKLQKFARKYKPVFGDEFDSLVDDLRAGKISENVKYLSFLELSARQPISLSEMPVRYLNNPDGRIFYMLKSFTIKQLDSIRRDTINEFKSGNKSQAAKNLIGLMTLLPLANMGTDQIKNILLGRGLSIDEMSDIPDEYISNIFKIFGANQYIMDRYVKRGEVVSAVGELVAPPLDLLESALVDIVKVFDGSTDIESLSDLSSVRQLPLIGRAYYNFFGGGLEKYLEEND